MKAIVEYRADFKFGQDPRAEVVCMETDLPYFPREGDSIELEDGGPQVVVRWAEWSIARKNLYVRCY